MASEQPIPEYERRRLENVKRNAEMMSSLKINSILSDLSSYSSKPHRTNIKCTYEKCRSSLRKQGIPPSHSSGLSDFKPSKARTPSFKGQIPMRNVYKGDEQSHQSFLENLSSLEMNSANIVGRTIMKEPVKVENFKLQSENIARVLTDVTVIRFLPTSDITVVVAGNRSGHLGFWKVNSKDAYADGEVHLYQPHSSIIYGVSVHPFSLNKVYSCCYDGLLRVMNIEREEFEVAYSSSSDSSLYSVSQQPNDANSIFIGEGSGGLNMYDVRAGKVINSWLLHEERINSIDINPANTNVIATASADKLACVWDLRKMSDQQSKCKAFSMFSHEGSIHSAYFSPSGSSLAITSLGNTVALLSGANFEDTQIIYRGSFRNGHNTCSRAIWGWDDTYLYMASRKRRVEVLSVPQGKAVCKLESSLVSAIPSQFDAHPCRVGMLAGATTGGSVLMWTNHDC